MVFINLFRSRMAAAAAMANDGHQNGRGRQATYSDGSIEREMERRPNDVSAGKEKQTHLCISAELQGGRKLQSILLKPT